MPSTPRSPARSNVADSAATTATSTATTPGRFRPRLNLQTLTRGDGLLGMRALDGFGPRDATVTVARVDWTYVTDGGLRWETPAPTRILNSRPKPTELLRGAWDARVTMSRDLPAEADARDALWATKLRPLPAEALQWRTEDAAEGHDDLWSLAEESHFGDFWAQEVPKLQAMGWAVVVQPGFEHQSVVIDAWKLVIDPVTGDETGRELTATVRREQPLVALSQPRGMGSWMLSLGVEVAGETLDLVPLLADLLKRDSRWLDAREIAAIPDEAIIGLRMPNGRRIESRAEPLKSIVGAMVDLLTEPKQRDGPIQLSNWEAQRIESMRVSLMESQAARAGAHGAWQLQGNAGLTALAERLAEAGTPRELSADTLKQLMPTPGLGLELRDYQRQGVAWLQYLREHHLGGILADDMGLGKTAQVLAHLLVEKHAGRLDLPALVVLPTSLIANWEGEARRNAPALRTLTLQGSDRAKAFDAIAGHDVVFTTYPLLWRDIDTLRGQSWHLVVLDEAQMVKNAGSRAGSALRRLQTRHRLCVTGTPLENHLGELWAHFDFLMPGFLGDWRGFTRHWRRPIEAAGDAMRAALLAQRVRPFILRRRKEDVASELPPKTEFIRRVQLQGEQRALYESVRVASDERVRKVLERKSFEGSQIAILAALLKLRQVCCDPRLLKGVDTSPTMERAKMTLLLEMLPALVEEGSHVLVFSQFTEMLALVRSELETIALPCLMLTGDTPVADRGELVRRFQAGEAPVFLISLKAGGVGLNLTAADTVIHLDPWWNPAVERQATDRAHRIGQARPVFVYKLVVEGSIEEKMLALQARKAALAEGVLGSDAAVSVKFDAADLQALMAPLDEQRT